MDTVADVRTRLILAGIVELEQHGLRDFSLRRVAQEAQVSCAAPYRHFRDKEELILAIIAYIRESWELLADNISSAFADSSEQRLLNLAVAALRFWLANGNLRSVLMSGQEELGEEKRREVNRFDAPILAAVRTLAAERGVNDSEELAFTVLALVYGTVTLVSCGSVGGSDGEALLRARLCEMIFAL
ncbi:MAG: TetR/AcrR family transcriptional regulator [Clostridia bacterium]|nr:TetR/AcrR family transcriptional regulator [Clostridia bacterium]MBR3681523.1 TetR/AcrR family transcriptional regulator [Clostridia bacterium]